MCDFIAFYWKFKDSVYYSKKVFFLRRNDKMEIV